MTSAVLMLEKRVMALESQFRRDTVWKKYLEGWLLATFQYDIHAQVEASDECIQDEEYELYGENFCQDEKQVEETQVNFQQIISSENTNKQNIDEDDTHNNLVIRSCSSLAIKESKPPGNQNFERAKPQQNHVKVNISQNIQPPAVHLQGSKREQTNKVDSKPITLKKMPRLIPGTSSAVKVLQASRLLETKNTCHINPAVGLKNQLLLRLLNDSPKSKRSEIKINRRIEPKPVYNETKNERVQDESERVFFSSPSVQVDFDFEVEEKYIPEQVIVDTDSDQDDSGSSQNNDLRRNSDSNPLSLFMVEQPQQHSIQQSEQKRKYGGFVCSFCGMEFKRQRSLSAHVLKNHPHPKLIPIAPKPNLLSSND